MLKDVRDGLLNIRNLLVQTKGRKHTKQELFFGAHANIDDIHSVIEHDYKIDLLRGRFEAALLDYTGGKSITAGATRSEEANDRLYTAAFAALLEYRNALRTAVFSEEARILALGSEIDVGEPFDENGN